ncbi:hypothetical protein DJ71_04305 [Halorubrum sp. E3]|nr:hypothetical protein DJ71_04305 [Halorubrum sp. E3]
MSDAPADIGDFDRLDVTLGEARIFEATEGGDGEDDEREQTGNETEGDDPANGTAEVEDGGDADDEGDEEGGEEPDDDEDDDGSDRGFTVVDLDGATVDLTQVIEEDAMAVFDGEIPAGEYEKIEHSVTAIEGIVGGEEVDVKLPSEKLQITSGFAVAPDESVSFVFDINVVKRGRNNGYILKPVISGSGVAGRDVEVNEVGKDDEDDGGENGETETDGSEDGEDDGSTSDGTETDDEPSDAEDGTTANGTDN